MDIWTLCALAVLSSVMALTLRRLRPEMGVVLALGAGALLLLLLVPRLTEIIGGISTIAREGGVPEGYMTQLLKVGGVSLMTDFAAQTCRDAGEEGLAMKVSLAGRVTLIALALPFMRALLMQIMSLSP